MNCPKCGGHISPLNLKPNCIHCGVNIMFYTHEDELRRDAKRAELEFASARIVVAKVRAAFIGSGLAIARLVGILLLAAALLIPVLSATFSLPMFQSKITLSGLGAYQLYSDGVLMSVLDFAKSSLFGSVTVKMLIAYGIYLLIVLLIVVMLVFEILSFLNIKKSAKDLAVMSVIGAVLSAALAVFSLTVNSDRSFIEISHGFGAYVLAAMFIAFAVINIKLKNKEIDLKLRENDLLRKETLIKVKNGEISLDDLSLPVFETEKEKEERLKALEEALKKEEEGKE